MDQLTDQFLKSCAGNRVDVVAGIWVEPGCLTPADLQQQLHQTLKDVERFKHWECITMWIIGNECETRPCACTDLSWTATTPAVARVHSADADDQGPGVSASLGQRLQLQGGHSRSRSGSTATSSNPSQYPQQQLEEQEQQQQQKGQMGWIQSGIDVLASGLSSAFSVATTTTTGLGQHEHHGHRHGRRSTSGSNGVSINGEHDHEAAVFLFLDRIAAGIKAVDPTRPVAICTADVGSDKATKFRALCRNVDVLGINSYGGAATLASRLVEQGFVGRYMLTEFGCRGQWECPSAPWGSPLEQPSTSKCVTSVEGYVGGVMPFMQRERAGSTSTPAAPASTGAVMGGAAVSSTSKKLPDAVNAAGHGVLGGRGTSKPLSMTTTSTASRPNINSDDGEETSKTVVERPTVFQSPTATDGRVPPTPPNSPVAITNDATSAAATTTTARRRGGVPAGNDSTLKLLQGVVATLATTSTTTSIPASGSGPAVSSASRASAAATAPSAPLPAAASTLQQPPTKPICIGAFAFYGGNKLEITPTWYSLLVDPIGCGPLATAEERLQALEPVADRIHTLRVLWRGAVPDIASVPRLLAAARIPTCTGIKAAVADDRDSAAHSAGPVVHGTTTTTAASKLTAAGLGHGGHMPGHVIPGGIFTRTTTSSGRNVRAGSASAPAASTAAAASYHVGISGVSSESTPYLSVKRGARLRLEALTAGPLGVGTSAASGLGFPAQLQSGAGAASTALPASASTSGNITAAVVTGGGSPYFVDWQIREDRSACLQGGGDVMALQPVNTGTNSLSLSLSSPAGYANAAAGASDGAGGVGGGGQRRSDSDPAADSSDDDGERERDLEVSNVSSSSHGVLRLWYSRRSPGLTADDIPVPARPGFYRIYAHVRLLNERGVATANIPLRVEGK